MGRATKAQIHAMTTQLRKKKKSFEWDRFCVAFMKMVDNNGMFKACNVEEKPEESCKGCIYNRKMKRYVDQK